MKKFYSIFFASLLLTTLFHSSAFATTASVRLNDYVRVGFSNGASTQISFLNSSASAQLSPANYAITSLYFRGTGSTLNLSKDDSMVVSFGMFVDSQVQTSNIVGCFISNSQYYVVDDCDVEKSYSYNETGDYAYNTLFTFTLHLHTTQAVGLPPPSLSLQATTGLFDSIYNSVIIFTVPIMQTYTERDLTYLNQIRQNTEDTKTTLNNIANSYLASMLGSLRNVESNTSSISSKLDTIANNSSNAAVVEQQRSTNSKLDDLKTATDEQTEQQAEQYNQEKQEEAQREQDIQDEADNAQINAQVTANPFESLFNVNECVNLPTISGWFNVSPAIQVCSPYPASIRPILNFTTSALMVGLLIRLYYKKMNGGYNG